MPVSYSGYYICLVLSTKAITEGPQFDSELGHFFYSAIYDRRFDHPFMDAKWYHEIHKTESNIPMTEFQSTLNLRGYIYDQFFNNILKRSKCILSLYNGLIIQTHMGGELLIPLCLCFNMLKGSEKIKI
ncbi:hypothetical protein ACTFIZ_001227 [Dictyostelium cf. discoideum]